MFAFASLILLLVLLSSEASVQRTRRGAYMTSSSYSRPSYGDQWNQNEPNNYNPYPNWNQNPWQQTQYQSGGNQYGSSYNRPSSYGPPQSTYGPPKSSYGRPEPSYSPYSRPSSSYGRPPQFYPQQPSVVPSVDPPVVTAPIVPPTSVVPEYPSPVAPVPGPVAPTDFIPTTSGPLFGGVEPGSGTLAPPPPPTDEEMTRVEAAEKENEVRKARGGPPGINVEAVAATGTLPPQAAIPEIPMPPV